jgi:hypothetical protein
MYYSPLAPRCRGTEKIKFIYMRRFVKYFVNPLLTSRHILETGFLLEEDLFGLCHLLW